MKSSSRNGAKVIWLGVHTTEGIMRATDLRDWVGWAGSSHAANDETGVLLSGAADGFVDYDRAAWTLRNGNPISDNLEQCGWARWTRAEWLARPKLLDTTAQWLAERHKARPWIPLVKLSPADVRARKPGILGHGDYSTGTGDGTHWDPGPNYPWDVVLDKARAYAAGTAPQEEIDMSAEARLWEGIVGRIDTKVLPGIDAVWSQLVGLNTAIAKLAEAVASDRDDLTAEELKAAVALGIQEAGEALRVAQAQAQAKSSAA